MPRYSAEQIYGFARRAGFPPDGAATMTAIALAESGGDSRAHNPFGEDSRGLWQINAQAHPELARRLDLYDPAQNARAAFEVSRRGTDASPWTVTHGGSAARYLRFREAAQQAAVAFGDGPGHGVFTGTAGYGHPLDPGGAGGTGGPGGFAAAGTGGAAGTPTGNGAAGGAGDNAALGRFIEAARAQVGDTYVFGAETRLDDSNPDTFDCSELTQWAANQAGVTIPDGATAQYLFLKQRGLLVPVDKAKSTPGALLFSFDREPRPGDGRTPGAHVAISTGDGRTIEARNSRDDVGQFDAGNRFEFAAVLPGISDGTATVPPPAAPPTPAPVTAPALMGGPDLDADGLTDAMERRLGLDPQGADTDGDNLSDGYEMAVSRSNAARADSDGDRLSDAFELAQGLSPAAPDSDRDGHLDGSLADGWVDTDRDGLDDALEEAMGLDPRLVDSDADGFGDALERLGLTDPNDPNATPGAPPFGRPPGAPPFGQQPGQQPGLGEPLGGTLDPNPAP